MALDDYAGSEVAVAVAATAAVLSPRVRGWLRRGAVYGLAGAMMAGDAVASFAHGVAQGAHQANGASGDSGDSPEPAAAEAGSL